MQLGAMGAATAACDRSSDLISRTNRLALYRGQRVRVMKVVLLGAGASKAAGYPLARKLMPAIKREAAGSNFLNLKTAWDAWGEFLKEQTGVLALLLNDSNPEVV